MKRILEFVREDDGAAAVEYGLLLALIAVALILGASAIGDQICSTFNGLRNGLSTVPAGSFAPVAC